MAKVIIVLLRQPRRNDPHEMRADPFWEYGSFGCTGCHKANLLHPARISELEGTQLAFVQGGHGEMKLVLLTSPITVKRHRVRCEVKWKPPVMPFRYNAAPLIIDNDGKTDFPFLLEEFGNADRSTMVGRFASSFRSRRSPLSERLGRLLIRRYEHLVRKAVKADFAERYEDALPYPPPVIDRSRKRSYRKAVVQADGSIPGEPRQKTCRTRVFSVPESNAESR
jgi:hypothetical protein